MDCSFKRMFINVFCMVAISNEVRNLSLFLHFEDNLFQDQSLRMDIYLQVVETPLQVLDTKK